MIEDTRFPVPLGEGVVTVAALREAQARQRAASRREAQARQRAASRREAQARQRAASRREAQARQRAASRREAQARQRAASRREAQARQRAASRREAQARQRAASRNDRRRSHKLWIAGGHRPPLQLQGPTSHTFCGKPLQEKFCLAAFLCIWFAISSFAGTSDVADAAMNTNAAAVSALIQQKANANAPQAD